MSDFTKFVGMALKIAPFFLGSSKQDNNVNVNLSAKDAALISVKKKMGSVTVCIGTRDTGKTEMAYRLAEFFERPTYAVSPQQTPPNWISHIKLEDIVSQVPPRSTLLMDDLPSYMSSADYQEHMTQVVNRIIPMVRHERQPPDFPVGEVHLIFITQSAAAADRYILDCDLALLKPLGLLMGSIERPQIAKIYRELVDPCFQDKPDEFIQSHAYIISRQFRGLIKVNRVK